jgi:transposase
MVHARRVIVNAIVYVNRTACAWRYPAQRLPALAHCLRLLRALARRRHLQLPHDG